MRALRRLLNARIIIGYDRDQEWRKLADRLGAEFVKWARFRGSSAVQLYAGDWIVTLDIESSDDATWTRMRAPFVNALGVSFSIRRHRFWHTLQRLFGAQDLEVGHVGFDNEFVIRGKLDARLQGLLDEHRIRHLMRQQPSLNLEVVRPKKRLFGPRLPEGVAVLQHRQLGVAKDLDQLARLFELFTETLKVITFGGDPDPEDVFVQISRLRGPGGRYVDGHVLWEGDSVRRDAAERLGELRDERALPVLVRALDPATNRDLKLRILAIDTLAKIGNPEAVGPLVRLLGDATVASGRPVNERSADAISLLGEGEVAASVSLALAGDPDGIRLAATRYRAETVDALSTALATPVVAHAARALVVLRAHEALPSLRGALRLWGPSDVGLVLEAAIRELESRAGLPRPVSGGRSSAETLPRPAVADGVDRDTLPRPTPSEAASREADT